jgi:hypothetical protein
MADKTDEILPEKARSTKCSPNPVIVATAKPAPLWKTVRNIPSGGSVRMNAREVLTQTDFINNSGVILLSLLLLKISLMRLCPIIFRPLNTLIV